MIPYGRQNISEDDIDSVVQVLRSDFLTQGPRVGEFEKAVAAKIRAKHAIAMNSATSALHASCAALGLEHGDCLWTSPISFVASANCGLYCGASVDFVDINPETFNICPNLLEQKLLRAEQCGGLPKVLVVVHLAGQSADMETIAGLSRRFNFRIIEDASHAIGGRYQNEYIGNCKYSDITVFSLHPVKIITSGEGGLALTNSSEIATKLFNFRSHGITRDGNNENFKINGAWYYEQISLGFNYRMTEIHASLGHSQLKRLDTFVTQRNSIARVYDEQFSETEILPPSISSHCYSAYHLYIVRFPFVNSLEDKKLIFDYMRDVGIGVQSHYIPIHTQPYYRSLGFNWGDFPNAENYYLKSMTIPLFADLTKNEQDYVINKCCSIYDKVRNDKC
ncbi:UDP-4-amino-4,6-dideoxy-N-acetyl-beta-L-altrosamine transaminase [Paracoccaceae bacterium]|nr:UDP-4-amino-4,6-dideoxy-N-acetyl-beta-L-altrosamine transaminase [Paracoccaceae bacterium]